MPWVRFTKDFDWRQPGFTVAFKAGTTKLVTRDAAAKAVAAERGEIVKRPKDTERVPYGS